MKTAALFAWLALAPLAPASTGFLVHNLVANGGGTADFADPNLVTPWGIATSATGPFWVCNAGTGRATVYSAGTTGFAVGSTQAAIPLYRTAAAHGMDYTRTICTGIALNETSGFRTSAGPATVILAGRGGTLSGWSGTLNSTNGQMMVDTSAAGWIYLGLALVPTTTPTPQLYAPNFATGTVDVYDSNWKLVAMPAGAFNDAAIPGGFAPFNVEYLNGKLYVTYARQSSNPAIGGVSDLPGVGNGYVNVYDVSGKLLQRLIAQGPLNSPWGVAIAPVTFGRYGGALLVGNSGDGLVHAFDPASGALLGTLQDQNGFDIQIPGLHALKVGNGADAGDPSVVYFAAGPTGQSTGRFGNILATPVITANVMNGATAGAEIGPNTFVTILGAGLSAVTRSWQASDFNGPNLPTSLSGVAVTINGQAAYPTYISPAQINVLTPPNLPGGPASVVVSDNGLTNLAMGVQTSPFGPAFFLLAGKYAVAQHANGTIVGAAALVPNNSTPAAPGETVALFATGLGNTNPPFPPGQIVTAPAPLAAPATVMIGGIPASVSFAGLVQTGVYQVNAVVPLSAPSGDNAVTVQVGGYTSPGGVFLTVR
jgi:uncharacterized protein (TIGR03118 family)